MTYQILNDKISSQTLPFEVIEDSKEELSDSDKALNSIAAIIGGGGQSKKIGAAY